MCDMALVPHGSSNPANGSAMDSAAPATSSTTIRAYLAAPYVARDHVRHYAMDLVTLGIDVTASWLDEEHEINAGSTGAAPALHPEEVARHAATDLDDIERCDVLVLFTAEALGLDPADVASGGRHVETGYAIAKGVPVIVVGQPENVFHRLAYARSNAVVEVADSWLGAVGLLVRMQADAEERAS